MKIKTEQFRKYLKILSKVDFGSILPADEIYLDLKQSLMAKSDGQMAVNIRIPLHDDKLPPITIPAAPFSNYFIHNLDEEVGLTIGAKQITLHSASATLKLSYMKDMMPMNVGRHRIADMEDADLIFTKEMIANVCSSVIPHVAKDVNYVQFSHVYVSYEDSICFYAGSDRKFVRYTSDSKSADFEGGFYLNPAILELLKKTEQDFEILLAESRNAIAFDSGPILITTPLALDKPLPYKVALEKGFVNVAQHTVTTSVFYDGLKLVSGTKGASEEWYSTMDVTIKEDCIILSTEDEVNKSQVSIPTLEKIEGMIPVNISVNLNHTLYILSKFKDKELTIIFNLDGGSPVIYANSDSSIYIANSLIKKLV